MKHLIFVKRSLILLLFFFIFDFLISIVLFNGQKISSGFNKKPEILINGSSMSGSGFNSLEIENLTGVSIATYFGEGVSVFDRYAMINQFFHMYPDGIKTVIYEVNPVFLSGMKTAANVYTHFFPHMDEKTMDRYIKENASSKEYYTHKIIRTTRFESRSLIDIAFAYLGIKSGNLKTSTLDSAIITQLISEKGENEVFIKQKSKEIFENTMDTIFSYNSNIILLMMPMYYHKLQSYNEEGYNNLYRYFEDYCSGRNNIEFLDLNQDSIIYDADNFADPLHFNAYGQRHFTDIIGSYLIQSDAKKDF